MLDGDGFLLIWGDEVTPLPLIKWEDDFVIWGIPPIFRSNEIMKPENIIDVVRRRIQDSLFLRGPDKYVGDTLLSFVNQTVKKMVMLRPDIFSKTLDNWVPETNKVLQNLEHTVNGGNNVSSFRLVEIFSSKLNTDEVILEEVDYDHFGRASRSWIEDAAGLPVKFMRHPRNANRFFLYPKPAAGVELVLEFVENPKDYTLSETIELIPASYFPAIVEGVIYHVLTIENSDNSSQIGAARANVHWDNFNQALGLSLQSRVITDSDVPPMPAER